VIRTAASTNQWRDIIDYEDEPIVSSDIIRSPFSATFDSLATMAMGEQVSKTLAWYDNGWGYAHRVVDLVDRFTALEEEEVTS
jgi:glyceraldehyde 3-phosphate dehydrogenase